MKKHKPRLRLVGQHYGLWRVIDRAPNKPGIPGSRWVCKCICGAVRDVNAGSLRSGASKSCGCLRRARTISACTRHGYSPRRKPSPIYNAWKNLRARCFRKNHPEFRYYGGRGIFCCASWSISFEIFLANVGQGWRPGLTLGRINNSDGYHRGNVRWMTPEEQQRPEHRRPNGTAKHDEAEQPF